MYLLNAFFGRFSWLPVCLTRNVKPRHVVSSCAAVQLNRKWLCGSWLEDAESVFFVRFHVLCVHGGSLYILLASSSQITWLERKTTTGMFLFVPGILTTWPSKVFCVLRVSHLVFFHRGPLETVGRGRGSCFSFAKVG